MDTNGNGLKDTGELPVFQKQNIGQAQMFGVEADGQYRLTGDLLMFAALTWTYGQNIVDGEPLSKVPPLHGRWGARYTASSWWVEGFTQFAGRQDRLSSTDKTDPRMDPHETAAWATLNVRSGVTVSEEIKVSGGIQNILDAGYREHGSGVDGAGFNVFLGIVVQY